MCNNVIINRLKDLEMDHALYREDTDEIYIPLKVITEIIDEFEVKDDKK